VDLSFSIAPDRISPIVRAPGAMAGGAREISWEPRPSAADKPVYDSRSMTRAQLHAVITTHEGPGRCLRLHVRPDGTIVTRDCLTPFLRVGRLLWLKTTMLAMAFWGLLFTLRSLPQRRHSEAIPEAGETRVFQGLQARERPVPPARPASPAREAPRQLRSPPAGPGDGPTPSGLRLFTWIDRAPPLRYLDAERD
jgi:hypothetical protein